MSARIYPTAAALKYRCKMGSTNAAVLPDPVIELATTSRPDIITGIANCWIGVGVVYYISEIALSNGRINLRS